MLPTYRVDPKTGNRIGVDGVGGVHDVEGGVVGGQGVTGAGGEGVGKTGSVDEKPLDEGIKGRTTSDNSV